MKSQRRFPVHLAILVVALVVAFFAGGRDARAIDPQRKAVLFDVARPGESFQRALDSLAVPQRLTF